MPSIETVEAGEHVDWAGFIAGRPVFALADGHVVAGRGEAERIPVCDGLSTVVAAFDLRSLALGGEDGAVHIYTPGNAAIRLREATGKWVDEIACGPSGALAAATGKQVDVFLADGQERKIECERAIGAIAFAPKGMRLALARHDGVDLVWVNSDSGRKFLEWKGAHIGVTFSPDGRYLVSTMQENALHGWRLGDERHMRMTGYPAKVKSVSWSPRGKWLASSGAPAAIVWPFAGKDGPMGKAPLELGSLGNMQVTQVCFNPGEEVVAAGYEGGTVAAIRIADGQVSILRKQGHSPISALGWNSQGTLLCFGSESGEAGIVDIAA